MTTNQGMPRNPRVKYHFKREELDFFFQWIVVAQTHGGSESGECFYAAANFKEGDQSSWVKTWLDLGERVEQRAKTSEADCRSSRTGYFAF